MSNHGVRSESRDQNEVTRWLRAFTIYHHVTWRLHKDRLKVVWTDASILRTFWDHVTWITWVKAVTWAVTWTVTWADAVTWDITYPTPVYPPPALSELHKEFSTDLPLPVLRLKRHGWGKRAQVCRWLFVACWSSFWDVCLKSEVVEEFE